MRGASALFVLAVLAKGSAVVLPVVFLILDVYPLGRLGSDRLSSRAIWNLLREKSAMLVFCAVMTAVAFAAKLLGVEPEISAQPLLVGRLAQACFGACFYVAKTLWPFGITAFYPRPEGGAFLKPVFAASVAMVVLAISAAVWQRRQRPWLLAGLAAYLIIASPFLGLARVGITLTSDRYSYAPLIVWVVVACAGLCKVAKRRWSRSMLIGAGAGATAVTCALMVLCAAQCRIWENSVHLWSQALEHAPTSPELHHFVGTAFAEAGAFEQADAELREALRLRPNFFEAIYDLGILMDRRGETDAAIAYLREAARLRPKDAMTHRSLGEVLVKQGQVDEAIALYREAITVRPNFAGLRFNLGVALVRQRRTGEAINELTKALELQPWYAEARAALGGAFVLQGRQDEAVVEYQKALELAPDQSAWRINLGLALAQLGRSAEAVAQLREAIRRDRQNPETHHVLAAILAEMGRMREAAAEYAEVLRLRPDHAQARAFLAMAKGRRL
jgi:Flp pilus assembly protein TadD